MPSDFSPQELMAVFLARDLKDIEHLMVGVAMPIVEAAVRLEHLMNCQNIELIFFAFSQKLYLVFRKIHFNNYW